MSNSTSIFVLFTGPYFIPLIGSMASFGSDPNVMKFPVKAIHDMAQKYGEVARVTMGSQHMVFLSGGGYQTNIFFLKILVGMLKVCEVKSPDI